MFVAAYQSKDGALAAVKKSLGLDPASFQQFSGFELEIESFLHPNRSNTNQASCYRDPQLNVFITGHIYNRSDFPADNAELSLAELVGRLFLERGSTFANDLNGDFIIFIEKTEPAELFVFRDHLGIVPLAYTLQRGAIYFSSDYIALSKHFQTDENTDFEYLLSGFKYLSQTCSLNSEVKKLRPGHYVHIQNGSSAQVRFWFPEKINEDRTLDRSSMLKQAREKIQEAIEIRCSKDHRAAAHVSGGLDSSLVAALARKVYAKQTKFYALSWSPQHFDAPDLAFDERNYVREICERNDMVPAFYDNKRIREVLKEPIYHPALTSFDEELTLKFAQENGIDLIFSGWGGDDFVAVSNQGILQDLFFQGRWRTLFKGKSLKHNLKLLWYDILQPYFGIIPLNVRRDLQTTAIYLQANYRRSDRKMLNYLCAYRARRDIHLNYLRDGHLEERAEVTYNLSQRLGITYRFPLLDKKLVEWLLSVPSQALFHPDHTRTILRSISEVELPESVRFRKAKQDPVIEASLNTFFEEFDSEIMENIAGMEGSETAKIFNFEALKRDWVQRQGKEDQSTILCAMYEMNLIHDFIKNYKEQ